MEKYTAKYFRDSIPEWKKKKDPLIARYFYRALSFYFSSFCANRGISANAVSYFSMFIAIGACLCYFFNYHSYHILGAILVNIWLLVDCIDGNIARSIKKQPFGEFADASSSYFLISYIYVFMGYAIYNEGGGLFHSGDITIVMLVSIATVSDSYTRLLYNKYNQGEREYQQKFLGLEPQKELTEPKVPSRMEQLYEALSIGGYYPIAILIMTLLHFLDLFLIYIFVFNIVFSLFVCTRCFRNAIKKTRDFEKRN